jgi:hypothetical protein
VGLADSDATTTVEQLGDHGDRWTFRFTAQGRPAGQVTVTRQQLEDGNWRFEIPPDVAARLRAERVPPTP